MHFGPLSVRNAPDAGSGMQQHQRSVARHLRDYVSREDVIDLCAEVLASVSLLPGVEVVPMVDGASGSRVLMGGKCLCNISCPTVPPQRAASVVVCDDAGSSVFADAGDAVDHVMELLKQHHAG